MEIVTEVLSQLAHGFVTSVLLFSLTLLFALPLGLVISFCSMSKFPPLDEQISTAQHCVKACGMGIKRNSAYASDLRDILSAGTS